MSQGRSSAVLRLPTGVRTVLTNLTRLAALAIVLAASVAAPGAARAASAALTLDERVELQRRIEEVYWRHRI